jgi:hypothetical protein
VCARADISFTGTLACNSTSLSLSAVPTYKPDPVGLS